MKPWAICAIALVLGACNGPGQTATPPHSRPTAQRTQPDLVNLGQRIWQNECAGSTQGLVTWNAGETFPSLGIGHFIWYPAGSTAPFEESFPQFIAYAKARGITVPAYFNGPAPWASKRAYEADRSGLADSMRRWLAEHIAVQTDFIVARSRAALPTLLAHSRSPQAVLARYKALAATTQGMYCLVDYVNFKGEGIKETERYNGQGWGLLQVLEEMRGNPQGRNATAEFARAAETVMRRRVANAPAARGEQRWLTGWVNRCRTYR